MNEIIIDLTLLFSFYSLIGWILETVFKSTRENKFINSGFLSGPFCPIYGFGAMLILLFAKILDGIFIMNPLPSLLSNLIIAIIITTLLEYYVGVILEKLFKCKWWDYSNELFNIKGRVCLKYSIFWGVLAYIFIVGIHPLYDPIITSMPIVLKSILSTSILFYFILDTIKSVNEILDLRQILFVNYEKPLEQFSHKIMKYKRIYSAFPRLHFPRIGKANQEIRGFLNGKIEKIKLQIKNMHF